MMRPCSGWIEAVGLELTKTRLWVLELILREGKGWRVKGRRESWSSPGGNEYELECEDLSSDVLSDFFLEVGDGCVISTVLDL